MKCCRLAWKHSRRTQRREENHSYSSWHLQIRHLYLQPDSNGALSFSCLPTYVMIYVINSNTGTGTGTGTLLFALFDYRRLAACPQRSTLINPGLLDGLTCFYTWPFFDHVFPLSRLVPSLILILPFILLFTTPCLRFNSDTSSSTCLINLPSASETASCFPSTPISNTF